MFDKIREWWENADRTQKVFTLFGVSLFAALLYATFYFSTRPSMKLLFRGLEPADQGMVVSGLEKLGIPVNYDEQGNVFVSESKAAEARAKLAINGKLPSSGRGGVGNLDGLGVLNTPKVEQERIKAALESELARSIEMMEGVRSARVHLNLGEDSPFISERRPPSASVGVSEASSMSVGREQARAIAQMVANAVPGLDLGHISIVSHTGRTLWDGSQEEGGNHQADHKIQAEIEEGKRRERELQRVLDSAFGPGNTVALVSVVMDFDKKIQETIERTPSEQPLTRESNEESMGGRAGGPGGIVGVASNVPNAVPAVPVSGGSGEQNYKGKQVHETYGNTEKKQRIEGAGGNLVGMSINVLVDQNAVKDLNQVNTFVQGYLGPYQGDPRFTATVTPVVFDRQAQKASEKAAQEAADQERMQKIISMLPIVAILLVGFMILRAMSKAGARSYASRSEYVPMSLPSGSEESALPFGESDPELPVAARFPSEGGELGAGGSMELPQRPELDLENIQPIPDKVDVPLEQVKKMAAEKPESVALLIKTWLAED
jgi:flagellar M-ring protein FliF